MLRRNALKFAGALALLCLCSLRTPAQRVRGELRLEVHDAQGAALAPSGELSSDANQFRRTFAVDPNGRYLAQHSPFGVYRLSLHAEVFASWSDLVEIRSEVPVHLTVTMGAATVATQVHGHGSATRVDPYRTGTVYTVGRQPISEQSVTQPGRDWLDLVAD